MSDRFSFTVDEGGAGDRLDRALASAVADMSRSRLQALIRTGQVTLDEFIVVDPGTRLRPGQLIELVVPPVEPAEPRAQNIPLDVVYEDADLIVIDKPAGLVVHPGAGRGDGTLVNALIAHCGDSLSGIGGVSRPGIVHRLDRLTSGLIVVAKNDRAHAGLARQFAAHGADGRLTRRYRGFAWGRFVRPRASVEARIGRHPTSRRRMAVVAEPNGRHAVTHIESVTSYGHDGADVTEFTAELETGRTHQIRVHLASIGHPLLGDVVYGGGYRTREQHLSAAAQAALIALARQALHAEHLGFEHPVSGEPLAFDADLPADLARLRQSLSEDAGQ